MGFITSEPKGTHYPRALTSSHGLFFQTLFNVVFFWFVLFQPIPPEMQEIALGRLELVGSLHFSIAGSESTITEITG